VAEVSRAAAKLYISIRAIDAVRRQRTEIQLVMSIHLTTAPIVSLIAGILILVIPRLLNYIVAIYLIIIGLLGLGILGGL
jgi:hypothetical protein